MDGWVGKETHAQGERERERERELEDRRTCCCPGPAWRMFWPRPPGPCWLRWLRWRRPCCPCGPNWPLGFIGPLPGYAGI